MKGIGRLAVQSISRRLTKRLLGRNACAIVARTPTGLFAVDPEDVGYGSVGKALLKRDGYGQSEIALLLPHLGDDSKLLVVGAHIGSLVVPLASHCREVVAFEANPRTYDLLLMNLALNHVTNCRAVNLAASDKNERLQFLASRANSGGSKRVPKVRDRMYYYDEPEVITVDAVRLDDHLGETACFDVILMDIEGSEYFALRGMPRLLARARVLQVEFLPHHLKNVGGISVEDFLAVVAPHFAILTIPSRGVRIERERFLPVLREMFERGEEDSGLLFEKA
jgi:FkbM family methyltransferase